MLNNFVKTMAAAALAATCFTASAAPISGDLQFIAVGSYIEDGGVSYGFDFSDDNVGVCPGGTTASGNCPGSITGTSGAIRDVLGLIGSLFGGPAIDLYDFDLRNPLPTLEWLVNTDNGSGIEGILRFEITGGQQIDPGSAVKDLAGSGVLSFTSTGANDPGFDPATTAGWSLTGDDHQFIITGTNVPEPTTLALVGMGLIGWSFTRRRKARVV